jgi:hypothetical protein
LVAIATACAGPQRPAAPPPPQSLRIGTWNIEWLGKPEMRRGKPVQTPEDIAKYLALCGVDLFGVNEVSRDGTSGRFGTNSTLTKALELLSRDTGGNWQHMLFPKENPNEADQLIGVAWNQQRLNLVGEPWRVPIRRSAATSRIWQRHPWAAKFSAGEGLTDLVVIPIHMKSNAGGKDVTSKQRSEEAKALSRSLGAVQNHFDDDDLVILGDSNVLSADELALNRFRGIGLRDLNSHDEPTWIKSDQFAAAPFDRILVPDDQPEFASSALRVNSVSHLGDEKAFRERLSDHYLTQTEMAVMADDD